MLRLVALMALATCLTASDAASSITYARLEREVVMRRLGKAVPANAERRAELKSQFENAGCQGENLSSQPVEGVDLGNIVCRLPGQTDSVILIAAHFDAHPDSIGAADNWSGAVMLPILYQSLHQRARKHTYVFVGLSDGINGHAGAGHFANSLSKDEAGKIAAAVVLDSLGLSFTRGWPDKKGKLLYGYLKGVSSTVKLPVEEERWKPVTKGLQPFTRRGIPSICIHSLNKYNYERAGGPEDTVDGIDPDEYFESYMLIASYLALLDEHLE